MRCEATSPPLSALPRFPPMPLPLRRRQLTAAAGVLRLLLLAGLALTASLARCQASSDAKHHGAPPSLSPPPRELNFAPAPLRRLLQTGSKRSPRPEALAICLSVVPSSTSRAIRTTSHSP